MNPSENLDRMAQAFIEQIEQDQAAGLAALPEALRAVVAATPDSYRGALLLAIDEYLNRPSQVSHLAGIQFGEVLGLLRAGCVLQVLTPEQHTALGDFMVEVGP